MRFLQVLALTALFGFVCGCGDAAPKGAIESANKAKAPPKGEGTQTITNADGTTSEVAGAGGKTIEDEK